MTAMQSVVEPMAPTLARQPVQDHQAGFVLRTILGHAENAAHPLSGNERPRQVRDTDVFCGREVK